MKQFCAKWVSVGIVAVLLVSFSAVAAAVEIPAAGVPSAAGAADQARLAGAVTRAADYLCRTVPKPQVGSIGGEWTVLGLARSGYAVPSEYYREYYAQAETYVKACQGVLDSKKHTEYARLIVALAAIGQDPAKVGGYNLLVPLADFDKTSRQGINGSIWALLALDAGNYALPMNPTALTPATRQKYIDEILARQLADGGWSLAGSKGSDEPAASDITAMALQALAKYQSQPAVKQATDRGINCLAALQDANGGYASLGIANVESVAQVIVALGELGVDLADRRFIKNGRTLLGNLMSYQLADGSFSHTPGGGDGNQMASEQGFCGLVAAQRATAGKNSFYRMSDALVLEEGQSPEGNPPVGLPGKHKDVKALPASHRGVAFADIADSKNRAAIEALAARGVVSGKKPGQFEPQANLTRAEFAAIVVRGLGLTPGGTGAFVDVPGSAWYSGYVGTAAQYGIVSGVGGRKFNPQGTLTRQEAAALISRAARLCGLDTALEADAVRNLLAQFGDYRTVAPWGQSAVAFCYQANVLDQSDLNIYPEKAIKRGEMAEMLFRLLTRAKLIG